MRSGTLVALALLTATVAAVTENLESGHAGSVVSGRGSKEDKMMQEMLQVMMLAKNMISFALMFVSPIMQIKGFGLSVINTLINIGRFMIQLQSAQEMKQMHMDKLKVQYANAHYQTHDSDDLWSSSSNRYAYYAPPPKSIVRQDTGVIENLPSARPSYTSPGNQQYIYPYYSSNFSRLR